MTGTHAVRIALAACALLFADTASATKPRIQPRPHSGCIFEGLLLKADGRLGYNRLSTASGIDWAKFEGKLVAFAVQSKRFPKAEEFLAEPAVVGVCDIARARHQLGSAWYSIAYQALEKTSAGAHVREDLLNAAQRALRHDPKSCAKSAMLAFAFAHNDDRAAAQAQLRRFAEMGCPQRDIDWLNWPSSIKLGPAAGAAPK